MTDLLIAVARLMDAGQGWWPVLLNAVVKATLLLALASLASLALRRASAALRHAVWATAVVSSLALPMLLLALPKWPVAVLPDAMPTARVARSDRSEVAPRPRPAPALRTEAAVPAPAPADAVRTAIAPAMRDLAAAILPSSATLLTLWAVVAVVLVLRIVVGHLRVRRLATTRADAVPWLGFARAVAKDAGLRPPTFVEGPAHAMPMTWGVLKPVVMLPASQAQWSRERLRLVLLHELAHVARRDCLTQGLANLGCALYWFNPLAWLAAARLASERERACDDWVLASGTDGPEYAEQLLDIARAMRPAGLLSWSTVAMARRSELEGRLLAILDPDVSRRPPTRRAAMAAAALVALVVPALAAVQPTTAPVTHVVEKSGFVNAPRASRSAVPSEPALVSRQASGEAAGASEDERAQDERGRAQAATTHGGPQPMPSPAPMPMPAPMPHAIAAAIADGVSAGVSGGVHGGVSAGVHGGIGGGVSGGVAGAAASSSAAVARGRAMAWSDMAEGREPRQPVDQKVIDALAGALADSDKGVREHALVALGRLGDRRAVGPVTKMLSDAAPDIREQAAFALGQMRDPSVVDPLVGALKDTAPAVREQAAFALAQLRDPKTVEPLMALVTDQNADVREQACFALAQLRDRRATPKLVAALDDADADVREQAAFALAQLRDPASVGALAAHLKDPKADVREQVAFALAQIREPSAVEPLIAALADPSTEVQEQAALALGQLGDARAVAALTRALQTSTSSEVRALAAMGLGQVGDRTAIDALTAALKDASAEVRQAAALAIAQLSGR